MDNLSTEHLSPPNLSCQSYWDSPEHSGKSHTTFTESPAQLNRISDDLFSTYPSSPHATNLTEEIKHICETDNPLTNGGSYASIEPLSLTNSISPKNSYTESKMKRGQHPVYPITSAQSIGQLFKTSDDVPLRQHDRLGSEAAPKPPHLRHNGGSASGGNQRGAMALNTPNTYRQSRKGPRVSSNVTVLESVERKADVAYSAHSAPQLLRQQATEKILRKKL